MYLHIRYHHNMSHKLIYQEDPKITNIKLKRTNNTLILPCQDF
jgi:hypothetical protein